MSHLAILIPTLEQIGGAESQVILLAEGLAERGWQVTIVALSGASRRSTPGNLRQVSGAPGAPSIERLSQTGVSYVSLRMRKAWIDPRGWLSYYTWACRHRPDILHAHLPHAIWFARCSRLVMRCRAVIETFHTSLAITRNAQLVYRATNWLSDRTTCVSHAVAHAASASAFVPLSKLTVLFNGIPLPGSRQHIPLQTIESEGLPQPFRWVAVGRLAPVKDYPTLLRALALIQAAASDSTQSLSSSVELTIVGAGPEEALLRTLAAELHLTSIVRFAGFQSDVQPYLAAADAFVLSSRWEGLPICVLEAQAVGLPVVSTDGSGTAEAMIHGQTGLMVQVGNASALAAAMIRIMSMPECQRHKMGDLGREFIAARFSLGAALDQWENLYQEVLLQHPRPTRWA